MSGSSLDGLDISYCEFILKNHDWSFIPIHQETIPFPSMITQLLSLTDLPDLNDIDIKFGQFIAGEVLKFIDKYQVNPDLIGSHGHTIIHSPEKGFTFQAGRGDIIAERTGITTVYDFRKEDVKKGGQGAPLVPVGDKLLFSEYSHCLNLGGFSNISFDQNRERIAFDICPVNTILNHYAKELNKEFDGDGRLGRQGKLNIDLLNDLNFNAFYAKSPPKSLSKSFVNEMIQNISRYNIEVSDILSTLYEHIAIQIASVIKNEDKIKVLFTGGGTKNTYLIERIRHFSKADIVIPEEKIIDFKEAIIFGLLAVLRIRNEINVYKSVTGASSNTCAGTIVYR